MHNVAGRLTSLHDQLNQFVYLTDNLNELRTNVQQIHVGEIFVKRRFYGWELFSRLYIPMLKKKNRRLIIWLNERIISTHNLQL
jgi:hypothetical protein